MASPACSLTTRRSAARSAMPRLASSFTSPSRVTTTNSAPVLRAARCMASSRSLAGEVREARAERRGEELRARGGVLVARGREVRHAEEADGDGHGEAEHHDDRRARAAGAATARPARGAATWVTCPGHSCRAGDRSHRRAPCAAADGPDGGGRRSVARVTGGRPRESSYPPALRRRLPCGASGLP